MVHEIPYKSSKQSVQLPLYYLLSFFLSLFYSLSFHIFERPPVFPGPGDTPFEPHSPGNLVTRLPRGQSLVMFPIEHPIGNGLDPERSRVSQNLSSRFTTIGRSNDRRDEANVNGNSECLNPLELFSLPVFRRALPKLAVPSSHPKATASRWPAPERRHLIRLSEEEPTKPDRLVPTVKATGPIDLVPSVLSVPAPQQQPPTFERSYRNHEKTRNLRSDEEITSSRPPVDSCQVIKSFLPISLRWPRPTPPMGTLL
ncbi:unnamed protein product [Protopolystoma xenopodis]|uniref:Uncharacterized protein n=1 Tax=Protopolystoma xenopodis TaxID=117903 RepID=A0A448WGA0_9PLAT|nr:unnamed protein product [Protopolystoma xenopodis]